MPEFSTPSTPNPYFDVIQHTSEGGLYVGTSSLNGRDWTGSLWYFSYAELATSWDNYTAATSLYAGVADLKVLQKDCVVLASDSGAVEWWKLEDSDSSLTCVASRPNHDDLATSIDILSDKSGLVSGGRDCRAIVWDSEQQMLKYSFRGHGGPINCVSCHPSDYNVFLSCGQDKRLLMWDLRQPKPAKDIDVSYMAAVQTSVAWQPNKEHMIAVATENGDVALADNRGSGTDYAIPVDAQSHKRSIHRISFSPTVPTKLASVSEDCTVAITDFSNEPSVTYRDKRHQDFVRGVSWSQSSGDLFTCGWDSKVFIHRH